MRSNPNFVNAMNVAVPQGSKTLGTGIEAMAFETPSGTVTRIGLPKAGYAQPTRPTLPEFAQPTSSRAIGNLRVEQGLPKAVPGQFGDPAATQAPSDFYQQLQSGRFNPIACELIGRPDNVGLINGQWRILDPNVLGR
jgi:hypothetical protein